MDFDQKQEENGLGQKLR